MRIFAFIFLDILGEMLVMFTTESSTFIILTKMISISEEHRKGLEGKGCRYSLFLFFVNRLNELSLDTFQLPVCST